MPFDSQSMSTVSNEFSKCIDSICSCITSEQPDTCVVAGDFNADFSRNNAHSNLLSVSMDSLGLSLCHYDNHPTFQRGSASSCLDHFFVSPALNIIDHIVLTDSTNPSDHHPVTLEFHHSPPNINYVEKHPANSRPKWYIDTDRTSIFQNHTDPSFNTLITHEIFNCNNYSCTDLNHRLMLSQIITRCNNIIIDGCDNILNKCHPNKHKGNCRGWTPYHSNLRDTSLWWHWLWVQSHRPTYGVVYHHMKSSRLEYHLSIKVLKKENKQKDLNKVLAASNDSRKFFQLVKSFNGTLSHNCPSINNKRGTEAANEFVQDLSNNQNVTTDHTVTNHMKHVFSNINTEDEEKSTFSHLNIEEAISQLKPGKYDTSNINSSVIKLLGPSFIEFLTLFLNSLVKHSYTPEILNRTILNPLLKANKKNICDTNSYRLIATISVFLKIFDYIVLNKHRDLLHTHDLQFAYKPYHSTSAATLVVKETIRHYINNDSTFYGCFLDATKAFDFVDRNKLFMKLLDRCIPVLIVRFYHGVYSNQSATIFWDCSLSINLSLQLGVLQGGVLSPVFFIVYIDDFYTLLKRSGNGCWIAHVFLGLVVYADDHALLCPSLNALHHSLNILFNVAKKHNLIFNPSKSFLVRFSKGRFINGNFSFSNTNFKFTDKVKYLGHYISHNLSDTHSITNMRNAIFWSSNAILQGLKTCHPISICRVLKSKCYNVYGSECIFIKSNIFKPIQTAWNKVLRRCFLLPYRTHTNIICHLSGTKKLECHLYKSSLNFLNSFSNCNNVTNFMSKFFLNNTNSYIGNNFWSITDFLSRIEDPVLNLNNLYSIQDIIDFKCGYGIINNFTFDDCEIL
jgi:hypothetical protein